MFERFDEWSRQVVVRAQIEARQLGHDYIGTEHLLVALLEDGAGAPAQVLGVFDVDAEAVRQQVVERVGRGEVSPTGRIPFTALAKEVLVLTLREALSLEHEFVRPAHILLGLLRVETSTAVQILMALGVAPMALRESTLRRVETAPF